MTRVRVIWTIAGAFAVFGIACDVLGVEIGGRGIMSAVQAIAIAVVFGLFATGISGSFAHAGRHARLLREGRRLPAVILRVYGGEGRSTRQRVDVRFAVRVEPAGEAPYELDLEEEIHPIEAPRLQPGKRVVVAVDPRDPRKAALHMDATRALDE
jgi:hypothetical protein